NPFVRKYLWDDGIIGLDIAKDILRQNLLLFQQKDFGLWGIYLTGQQELIGYVGLWFFFAEPQPQLMYALNEDFIGQGIATEAAKRIIDYAFEELNFFYLLATTDAPHLASQRVAMRLGMELKEKKLVEGKETWFYFIDRQRAKVALN
ncbi:MAG: GNAT family N-acetyltransferase, partial [Bacteroidota bacterium]